MAFSTAVLNMLYVRLGTLVDCITNAYSKLCPVHCCFYNLASGNNLAAIKMSRLRGIVYKHKQSRQWVFY